MAISPLPDEPNFDALRHRLKEIRKEKGYTTEKVADLAGIARRSMFEIESGESRGTLMSWFKISVALETNLGDLVNFLYGPMAGRDGKEAPSRS